tara:strand:- start:2284 stop:2442 length:159 start_codon:yes stop_codon:yes gene_type:complete
MANTVAGHSMHAFGSAHTVEDKITPVSAKLLRGSVLITLSNFLTPQNPTTSS